MPIGEIETHPYLNEGKINNAKRMIMGSFPVYECSDHDSIEKQKRRDREGTIRFFYGSNRNSLWAMYSLYVDSSIEKPWDKDVILKSLRLRGIAISDTIFSCERYIYKKNNTTGEKELDSYSSEDCALHKKRWNKEIIKDLLENGVVKILCTSKGVLSNLQNKIIEPAYNGFGKTNQQLSQELQANFLQEIDGISNLVTNPIARVFTVGRSHIEAIAMPSPGSPQRQIKEFGYEGNNWREYADKYFAAAFTWLIN